MKNLLLLTLLVVCLSFTAYAQKAAAPPPTSATSTIEYIQKDGHPFTVTTNRRFSHVFPPYGSMYKSVLLLEEFRSETSRDVEGANGSIKIDAWVGKGEKPDKKAWTIKSTANTGEASGDFYKATEYGCCASASVMTWYNLLTGQKVFTGTTNWVKLYVPNSGEEQLERYVTFHGSDATTSTAEMKKDDKVVGVLQYSTKARNLLRLIVTSADTESTQGTPEIAIKHRDETTWADYNQEKEIGLWGSDGKKEKSAITNFSVLLKWDDDKIVEIPFKNDAPVFAEAKLLPKMKLELPAKAPAK